MEVEMLSVGDIIDDHEDKLTGVVASVDVETIAGLKVGSVVVHWFGVGPWGTPPALAQEALDSGDWTVQENLATSWGWVFPERK
jgi:hypothetical protein